MAVIEYFKTVILVQLFYSMAITLVLYGLPADTLQHVDIFDDIADDVDLGAVGADIQDNLEKQSNMPLVELGALVFYSGNLLLDLLLNFAFAMPQMLGMLVNGIMLLINVDSYIFAVVQLFASVAVMALYFISIIQLLTNVRSGQSLT